jgi:hypothetical protein
MTLHEDLIGKVAGNPSAGLALLRVLELHTPTSPPAGHQWVSGGQDSHCSSCDGGGDPFVAELWPCSTVVVIAEVLGVPIGGDDHDHESS